MKVESLEALRSGALAGARELKLSGGLTEFPHEIFGLAQTLEVLDLSGNALTRLPDDMGRFTKLEALFCSGNRFDRLPPSLGDCPVLSQVGFRATGMVELPAEALSPRLRWLTLTDNQLAAVPDALGKRPTLQKLMLAGNRLDRLPESLQACERLELLRLSANRFEAPPPWLTDLPSLAWLACAGNPMDRDVKPEAAQAVSWSCVEVEDLLGEGASGQVHRALWRRPDEAEVAPEAVALKLFKGAMTSDGLPEREMAACLAAGAHPHLTGALGQLVDHPHGLQGLLMPLLPAHWRVLAGPPSRESCSRDVYDPALRLDLSTALRIARSIGLAAAHLHSRGLLHGDLYGHNVLWDGAAGEAVLSDFGAGWFLPDRGAEAYQRLEVRAWGLLLGELLDLCDADAPQLAAWRGLQRVCTQPDPAARPLLPEALDVLSPSSAETAHVLP
jgi:hypothetical protein